MFANPVNLSELKSIARLNLLTPSSTFLKLRYSPPPTAANPANTAITGAAPSAAVPIPPAAPADPIPIAPAAPLNASRDMLATIMIFAISPIFPGINDIAIVAAPTTPLSAINLLLRFDRVFFVFVASALTGAR